MLIAVSAHVIESNDPWPVGLTDHVTSPVGVLFCPELLSVRVAVQLLAEPIRTDDGEQSTVVWVLRATGVVPLTLALAPVPLLFGVIEIVAVFDPNVCGLKVTVNVVVPPLATSIDVGLTVKLLSVDATTALLALVSLFVTVKVCAVLESPTPIDPKLKLVGLTDRFGGSNWVEADRPDVSPVAVTLYRPGTVTFRVNW
jgi:hypothetical protein